MENYEDWKNEHNGAFNLIVRLDGDSHTYLRATGFLVNTSTRYNYDMSNRPYAFTCYHFLKPIIDQGHNIDNHLKDDELTFVQFHNYKLNCSDVNPMLPRWEPAYFDILERGNWTNDQDYDEDYLFLQFGDYLNIHYICSHYYWVSLPGWRRDLKTNYDYSEYPGCYIFHHGNSIPDPYTRKYAIDNEYAVINADNPDLINLRCDKGYTTSGASGAPIFSSTHQIIGMNLAGINWDADPELEGNLGLSFSNLWDKANLEKYLGNEEIVYTLNTHWENLPAHCDNCEYDYGIGETGLDCGGPCKPCKSFMGDNVDLNTFKSGQPTNVWASNQISLSGSSLETFEI